MIKYLYFVIILSIACNAKNGVSVFDLGSKRTVVLNKNNINQFQGRLVKIQGLLHLGFESQYLKNNYRYIYIYSDSTIYYKKDNAIEPNIEFYSFLAIKNNEIQTIIGRVDTVQ